MAIHYAESVTHVIRNEVLEFQPSETSRTVLITLVDDQVAGESLQVFNLLLSSVLDQPVDTEVRNGLAQVFVSDDDEFQGMTMQCTCIIVGCVRNEERE